MVLGAAAAISGRAARAQQPEPAPEKPPEQPAAAQPSPPPATPEQPPAPAERPVTVKFHLRSELGFESDFSDAPGKVSVLRAGGDVDVGIPVGMYAQLNLGVDFEHSNYDFHNATGLVPGTDNPFDTIERTALKARFAQHLSREWSYLVGGTAALSFEEGADVGQSLQGVLYGAPTYALSDKLSIGAGVVVSTRLEDNALVLPLVILDWDVAEHWNLSNNGELGLTLAYSPNERWSFSVGGHFEYRDFRLDEHGPLPNGVGRDSRWPVAFTVMYKPTARTTLEADVGVYVAQRIEVLDANGTSISDQDINAAPYLKFALGFRF
jgi:hypothetical protein